MTDPNLVFLWYPFSSTRGVERLSEKSKKWVKPSVLSGPKVSTRKSGEADNLMNPTAPEFLLRRTLRFVTGVFRDLQEADAHP
jgi:hypothetical protein